LGLICPSKAIILRDIDDYVRKVEDDLGLIRPRELEYSGQVEESALKAEHIVAPFLDQGQVVESSSQSPKVSLERVPIDYLKKIDECLKRGNESVSRVVLQGSCPARFIGKDLFLKETYETGYPLEVMTSKIYRHFLQGSQVLCPEVTLLDAKELDQPASLNYAFRTDPESPLSFLVMRKFKGLSFWEGLGLKPAFKGVSPVTDSMKEQMAKFTMGIGRIPVMDVLIGNNDRIWSYEMEKKPYYEVNPYNLMVQSREPGEVDRLIAIDNEPHKLTKMMRELISDLRSGKRSPDILGERIAKHLSETVEIFSAIPGVIFRP
jgi:hypothetical protein